MSTVFRGTKNLKAGNPEPLDDIEPMLWCGVVGFQEAAKPRHKRAIRSLKKRGWDYYMPTGFPGYNPIIWDTDRYELVGKFDPILLSRDSGGKGDVPRYLVEVALRRRDSGLIEIHQNVHFVHQAFSSHRERRPFWHDAARTLTKRVRIRSNQYHGIVVGGGDVNRHMWTPSNARGHLPPAPTLKGSHVIYDTLWTVGVKTGEARRVSKGRSDHTGVTLPIHHPKPKPKPKPEPDYMCN